VRVGAPRARRETNRRATAPWRVVRPVIDDGAAQSSRPAASNCMRGATAEQSCVVRTETFLAVPSPRSPQVETMVEPFYTPSDAISRKAGAGSG
jgi:hypothetical protein